MTSMKYAMLAAVASTGLLFSAVGAAQTTVVTFDNGGEGWDGNGLIEDTGGNPGANGHFLLESFGIEFRTDSNPAFIGDLTHDSSITIGLDVLVNSITFKGTEVSRNQIVEFRSHALADGKPYTSVWYNLGVLQAGAAWNNFAVTFVPASEELPAGWGGYGAEGPNGEPILPEGVTFADVMATVDEVAFTTFEPGWFYGPTVFDVRIDNLRIERSAPSDVVFADGFDTP